MPIKSDPSWIKQMATAIGAYVMTIIPCILLLYFTISLIAKVMKTRMRRQVLKGSKSENSSTESALLAILILFLICELPYGALLIPAVHSTWWIQAVFRQIVDFMFMLRILNASLNFIIYAFMSSQFRRVFRDTVRETLSKVTPSGMTSSSDTTLSVNETSSKGGKTVSKINSSSQC